MKTCIYLLVLLALTGCTTTQPAPKPADNAVLPPVQFGAAGAGITRVNENLKFVVVNFTGRVMPALGTKLNVYRGINRVGIIQLTPPTRPNYASADILAGNLRVGDEAR